MTFSRSNGAVDVLETAPAKAPANKWRHQRPVSISVWVKSSGTFRSSPMSRYCGEIIFDNKKNVFACTLDVSDYIDYRKSRWHDKRNRTKQEFSDSNLFIFQRLCRIFTLIQEKNVVR